MHTLNKQLRNCKYDKSSSMLEHMKGFSFKLERARDFTSEIGLITAILQSLPDSYDIAARIIISQSMEYPSFETIKKAFAAGGTSEAGRTTV